MSRAASPEPRPAAAEDSTGTGSTRTRSPPRADAGASAIAPSLHGSSSGARPRRRRSSETVSTSAAGAASRSADSAVHPLGAKRLEARRALQSDRLDGRGAQHVEAGSVALLDRRHGRLLAPPRKRPDDREAGRDTGDL